MQEKRKTSEVDLDEVDKQIISLLQENGRRTNADIARLIEVSESTVKNRINRLIDKGILRNLAVLNPQALGFNSDVLVGICVKQGKLEETGEALKKLNEVVYLGYITGRFDIMAEVLLHNSEELLDFLRERLGKISGIVSTETFFVLKNEKINYEWKLPKSV
jgi:Lrp/AsnC family transcriptional regulator, regulator for asnA, asnC and gidA